MFKTRETMALNNSLLLKYSIDDTNLGFYSFPNARYICLQTPSQDRTGTTVAERFPL